MEEKDAFIETPGSEDFFAIDPRTDCPHLKEDHYSHLNSFLQASLSNYKKVSPFNVFCEMKCEDCPEKFENWLCLECNLVFCSRYKQAHMAKHNDKSKHSPAFSFSDGSFWCYECDSYITDNRLAKLRKVFGFIKHKLEIALKDLEDTSDETYPILAELHKKNEAEATFSRTELIDGLRNKKFKNICAITGAGISVAAGIPDFRSPGGLYHNLAKEYNLTTPEEIMTIEFFKKSPEPLYKIMKEFLGSAIKPTKCHEFFALLEDRKQLLKYFTQNIDGLESVAGMTEACLLQAHGHIRSCSCSVCKSKRV